jgi:hypothetical protein
MSMLWSSRCMFEEIHFSEEDVCECEGSERRAASVVLEVHIEAAYDTKDE